MKKIILTGMLILTLVLVGCVANDYVKDCYDGYADDFCRLNNCSVSSVHYENGGLAHPCFYVYINKWRETKRIPFSQAEIEFCESYR